MVTPENKSLSIYGIFSKRRLKREDLFGINYLSEFKYFRNASFTESLFGNQSLGWWTTCKVETNLSRLLKKVRKTPWLVNTDHSFVFEFYLPSTLSASQYGPFQKNTNPYLCNHCRFNLMKKHIFKVNNFIFIKTDESKPLHNLFLDFNSYVVQCYVWTAALK